MAELIDCPHCDGYGGWLPAGTCGGCEFCPRPRWCESCAGTGRVFVADLEPDEDDEPSQHDKGKGA